MCPRAAESAHITKEEAMNDDDDIPAGLIEMMKGMSESRIMEKLALTEDILKTTKSLSVDEAFAMANAAVNGKPGPP
jgi:hypothetical protein